MNRLVLAAVVASFLSAPLPVVAVAQVPTQDSATGFFALSQPGAGTLEFRVDAHSGPSGENPTGSFVASPNSSSPTVYSVACLAVSGNTAVGGFNFTTGTQPFGFIARMVDDSVDTFALADRFFFGDLVRPDECTGPLQFFAPLSVVSGNIRVVDAPTLPTSKDQCKNGGWRTYGIFKNQGDCVSFVATGGRKNPPAG